MWRRDVVLEQVGPFLDGHLGELGGRQVGQLVAGLVNGIDLELLLRLVGRFAGQRDQMRQRVRRIEDRRHRQADILTGRRASSRCSPQPWKPPPS